ncbi:Ldh family oxidoreductase [Henriciella pelagia]|jgi:LDH2 family malate/lactate/ureidoglycolate dehydrogenase|uniref:Dehydrogenase n=1 Tax=Henriciella pelagia TaxID=1977912 RepID=A0ABQ1JGB9_9PROT|nr:Ldh family oxidoreductase [Henriciella pelagia]GGB67845.1 dehydrogenase [Henriciella pelagia]
MRIPRDDLAKVTFGVLTSAGVDAVQAGAVTENLVWCDMVGRRNHGVERLPILLKRAAAGGINCQARPQFTPLSPPVQRLRADNGFGHYAGKLAMDRACELASEHGVGVVGVSESNFFGAGAYYSELAAQRGMISLVLSNSFPKVAAPGGLKAVLGTNPFTFGAPRSNGRSVLVDMSTAAVAGSTVREKAAKGEVFEPGIAIDAEGAPILDPNKVMSGTLLPAAGGKGFGLAIMVEILGAVLTGAGVSKQVGSMYKHVDAAGNNGQFFIALDVSFWMSPEAFGDRMEFLAETIAGPDEPGHARLPGEARWAHFDESALHGIALEQETLNALEDLAHEHGVDLPWAQCRG